MIAGSVSIDSAIVGHLSVRRRESLAGHVLRTAENAPAHHVPHGHGRDHRIPADPAGSEFRIPRQRRRRVAGEVHGRAEATQIGSVQANS